MTLRLQSIDHGPVSLPQWRLILADLGNPPARRVARVLGISERSVYRYNRTGYAPRVCMLALFWLTSWGRASVHAQAWNDAQAAIGYASALRTELADLRVTVKALERRLALSAPLHGGSGA